MVGYLAGTRLVQASAQVLLGARCYVEGVFKEAALRESPGGTAARR